MAFLTFFFFFSLVLFLVDLHTLSGNIIVSSIHRVSMGFYKTLDGHFVIEFYGFPIDPLGATKGHLSGDNGGKRLSSEISQVQDGTFPSGLLLGSKGE